MAQILKFQQGGKLTIDGVDYDINDHLISQYRMLGQNFKSDSDEKYYYNQFMTTLQNGKTDSNVHIIIDRNNNSISGIDLNYTNRQMEAISKNQTEAGNIITEYFRPKVRGAKDAARKIGEFTPSYGDQKFNHYSINETISLNHQYNDNGEFTLGDNNNKILQENQDDKIKLIESRIDFAKNIGTIPIHDKITGYNGVSRKELEDIIKEIGDLDAFRDRLINGSYDDKDEEWAKVFGIFMDSETLEDRNNLQTNFAQEQIFTNAGAPESWMDYATINNDGYFVLKPDANLPLEPGYDYYFLNNEFFDKHPIYAGLKGNSENGYFLINNTLYNADDLTLLPEGPKAIINKWITEKKNNLGVPTTTKIYDDWYGDSNYRLLNERAYYEGLMGMDLYGVDLQKYYNLDAPSFAIFNETDPQYDQFGNPILRYITKKGDSFVDLDIHTISRRPTPLEGTPSLDTFRSYPYREISGSKIANLGELIQNNIPYIIFYDKTNNIYYALSKDNKLYKFDHVNRTVLPDFTDDKNIINALKQGFQITSFKHGGNIKKFNNGGETTWRDKFVQKFPVDFALGIAAHSLADASTKKYFNKLKDGITKATILSLPQNSSEIYPIYSENGLTHDTQKAKEQILRPISLVSDVNTKIGYELARNSQLAAIDLNAAKTRSENIDNYRNSLLERQQQYTKERSTVDNAARQAIGNMKYQKAQINANITKQIGENLQKHINEFRESRDKEITRRNYYKLKALEANASGIYKTNLYKEFINLGGWDNVDATIREKYNGDPYKYMEGEHPDKSHIIKSEAFNEIYTYMMNDPYGSTISPIFNEWSLDFGRYIPEPRVEEYDIHSWKQGGKLNYIKTLYNIEAPKDIDLIKIFSKI